MCQVVNSDSSDGCITSRSSLIAGSLELHICAAALAYSRIVFGPAGMDMLRPQPLHDFESPISSTIHAARVDNRWPPAYHADAVADAWRLARLAARYPRLTFAILLTTAPPLLAASTLHNVNAPNEGHVVSWHAHLTI